MFSDLKGFEFRITVVYAFGIPIIWSYTQKWEMEDASAVSSSSLATFLVILIGIFGRMLDMLLFDPLIILFEVSN